MTDQETKAPTDQDITAPSRSLVSVPADQGEFHHQADDADEACLSARPAPTCACGLYDLAWETA